MYFLKTLFRDMFFKLKHGFKSVKLRTVRLIVQTVLFTGILTGTSMSFKVGESSVRVSNSLDPNETPSNSASHPDPSCLHIGTLVANGRIRVKYGHERKTRLNCNVDWKNASSLLGPSREDDLRKIQSYKFEGIQNYIDDLFPPETMTPRQQDYPVLVSAFSSNHFGEGLNLVQNLRETILKKYDHVKLIIFDLGLTREQGIELDKSCSCEVRRFPFEKYPIHVRYLLNYTWKAIAIQIVAKEYPFVFWMDASVRLKTSQLDSLFADVKKQGVLIHDLGNNVTIGTIAERTHGSTFEFLDENPCAYSNQAEKEGTFIAIYADPFITQYFLKPWVSCALSVGCMDPGEVSSRFLSCPQNISPFTFQLCHRFDQSVLGILYTRLFHNGSNPGISTEFYKICRGKSKEYEVCFY